MWFLKVSKFGFWRAGGDEINVEPSRFPFNLGDGPNKAQARPRLDLALKFPTEPYPHAASYVSPGDLMTCG